ncbi:Hsp20/alpha crystallin family protein [Marinobacterium aestuariivivens]|uniref:Hsp20/alpha crystallin family protein n=1 Tax=Marinobacterium aestuariivivens TaxID=1698799 RepID=A0ABW1ZYC1_9GAMM
MNLQKLNPWNWFKHEEGTPAADSQIPIQRSSVDNPPTAGSASHPMMQLHREIDRLFDEAFRGFGLRSLPSIPDWSGMADDATFRPRLNVSSDEKSYEVSLEAPGMTRSDLSLDIKGDVLTIRGEKREEQEDREKHYYRVERRYGMFQRVLSLPDDADIDAIAANMKDGVLKIRIPRREVAEGTVKSVEIGD